MFSLFSLCVCANDQELFLRANQLYESHDYDNALSSYMTMSRHGTAALYNIGNCYFHKNDYARALAYWARAKKGATRQECIAIDRNSDHVLCCLQKQRDGTWVNWLVKIISAINMMIPLIIEQFLFFLCWVLLWYLYGNNRLYKTYFFFLTLLLCILAIALYVRYRDSVSVYGFAVKKTPVLSCPTRDADYLGVIEYADCVKIRESRKEWYKVRYSDNIGWVEADTIQIV